MIDLLESIEEIAKCPVCLDRITPPVTACVNGHGMCKKCGSSLSKCSLCQEPLLAKRPKMLEQLLDALPKPCTYSDQGCLQLSYAERHETYCDLRPFHCCLDEDNSCTWHGSLRAWLKHADNTHLFYTYKFGSNSFVVTYTKFLSGWSTKQFCLRRKCDVFILYVWKNRNNELVQVVRHVPVFKPTKSYQIKLTFKKGSAIVFKFPLKAVVLDENKLLEDSLCSFRIPLQDMKCLVDKDGDIVVNGEIEEKHL